MADRFPDSSKMYLQSVVVSSGKSEKITSFSASAINPSISNADFVSCGNSIGELCLYDPEYIRRVDSYDFAPDEFVSD